jgi:hypothetical protein
MAVREFFLEQPEVQFAEGRPLVSPVLGVTTAIFKTCIPAGSFLRRSPLSREGKSASKTSQFRKKPSQFLINAAVFPRIYDGETGIPDKRI